MNCHSCGGSNGLIIYKAGSRFPTPPRHKYNKHCIETLVKRVARLEEKLNEISDFDLLVMEPL